jgi:hypothetical protein
MGNDEIIRFLQAIDDELVERAGAGETIQLHVLGRAALILGYAAALMTKDVDIVHVEGSRLQEIAMAAFGRDSPGARLHGFYLESVSSGLPPLPSGYRARCIDIPGAWVVIRPKRLEANDLAVTKLKRFHARDRQDIQILCDTALLDPQTLRERLEEAHLFTEEDEPGRIDSERNLEVVIAYLDGRRRTL